MRVFVQLVSFHQAGEVGLRGNVRVTDKVGLDALCQHGHGASVINTQGDNDVQKVILVIVTGEGVSKYLCACSEHTLPDIGAPSTAQHLS